MLCKTPKYCSRQLQPSVNTRLDKKLSRGITLTAQLFRGVVLGVLLFAAIVFLIVSASGAFLFRYQGF